MNNVTVTARLYTGMDKTFEEAVEEAVKQEGRRFSPLLTARLRDKRVAQKLKAAFDKGHGEALENLYRSRVLQEEVSWGEDILSERREEKT